jgi:hypothetical protein
MAEEEETSSILLGNLLKEQVAVTGLNAPGKS